MKVVILAGGFGTRISEESMVRPKPMVEIGGKPILWHIMKHYSYYGFHEFILCCGYKQHMIKEWFANYYLYNSDVTFDFSKKNAMMVHNNISEPWKVTLVDTGLDTMTGGRIKRVAPYIGNEPFMLTYGDGVSNVDLNSLLEFHRSQKKIATVTGVMMEPRFGLMKLDSNGLVQSFREKKNRDSDLVNSGFMVLEPEIFSYIQEDATVFEREPMEQLVKDRELNAYYHKGFWKCMDTQRDKEELESLWESKKAPWKMW
ncbi:MAG: glucose-1-phosphate cytidylyltransferase [Lachnospiraceae bacterium]